MNTASLRLYLTSFILAPYFSGKSVYSSEIHFGDKVEINLQLRKSRRDMSRWTMIHEIWKMNKFCLPLLRQKGCLIDTHIRKLAAPPPVITDGFEKIPKSVDFRVAGSCILMLSARVISGKSVHLLYQMSTAQQFNHERN